jgi:hypothetical protein
MRSDLVTWAEHYLRARDAFERKMVSMEKTDTGLVVTYKNRKLVVVAQDKLDDTVATSKDEILLVTAQTDANFAALLKAFAAFAEKKDLTVVFVNPKLNEKWLLKPAIHASVADKESLKAGLTTMFQAVPTI